jgi:hypothetical protein
MIQINECQYHLNIQFEIWLRENVLWYLHWRLYCAIPGEVDE